jgi:hypothetical protein
MMQEHDGRPTHRLLAQRVRLVSRAGHICLVEYEDGSLDAVPSDELVTAAAVRRDQKRSARPTEGDA